MWYVKVVSPLSNTYATARLRKPDEGIHLVNKVTGDMGGEWGCPATCSGQKGL